MKTTKVKNKVAPGRTVYILLYPKDKKSREEEMIIEVKINSALEVAGLFGDEDQARKTAKILLLGKGAIDSFK